MRRKLDYHLHRSKKFSFLDLWNRWVGQWYDGKYLLRHGVKRPHYFTSHIVHGHHFPFPEYGYAIYFRRVPENASEIQRAENEGMPCR